MIEGFSVNGRHSFQAFGLRILKRSVAPAPKDEYKERVPFSSVTYDFSRIYNGKPAYGERTLTYKAEFICLEKFQAQLKLIAVLDWLKWVDRQSLYDDLLPGYHFDVSEPTITWSEDHGVYSLSIVFPAAPDIYPNDEVIPENMILPDVNGDGSVNSIDSSLILAAYGNLATGEPSGLTPEQAIAADANCDGAINSADASMVLEFYALCSTGHYTCDTAGWTKYFNDKKQSMTGGVI